jgi:hypothetical protein
MTVDFTVKGVGHYAVSLNKEPVGSIVRSPSGSFVVSDIRQGRNPEPFDTLGNAFQHFQNFNWKSSLGSNMLLEQRTIYKRTTTKRWADN